MLSDIPNPLLTRVGDFLLSLRPFPRHLMSLTSSIDSGLYPEQDSWLFPAIINRRPHRPFPRHLMPVSSIEIEYYQIFFAEKSIFICIFQKNVVILHRHSERTDVTYCIFAFAIYWTFRNVGSF